MSAVRRVAVVAALLVAGCAYWQAVCAMAGVREPWDAARYWSIWYPVALLLGAVAALPLGRRDWWAGVLIVFAQAPVMLANGAAGPLLLVGLLFLSLLAVPAAAVSALAGWLIRRRRDA